MKCFRLLAFAVVFAGAAASAHAALTSNALVANALTSNALIGNSLAIGAVSGNARVTAVELPAGSN
jgi:hypothetical protein